MICDCRIGHNGSGIGINKNNLQSFLFESKASLRTGIVKFSGLSNYDWTGTNYKYFFYISIQWHAFSLLP